MWDWLRRIAGRDNYTTENDDYMSWMADQSSYDLTQYPWIGEFDITNVNDQNKIRRIMELLNHPHQSFRIFKANSFGDSYGRSKRQLAEIGFFPTADDVWDLIGSDWGGRGV